MFSLATCRNALGRTAWLRGVGLLLAVALVAAGLPRWELHAHTAAEHGHTHGGVLAEHDEPVPASGDAPASVVPHIHDVASVSATLPSVEPLRITAVQPDSWLPPFHSAPAATSAGPPPHRPPIV